MKRGDEIHPIDKHVGARIREIRALRGLTQVDIADKLKISFQQLQKYEQGNNRASSSRLWEIAEILGVDVRAFFPAGEATDLGRISPKEAAIVKALRNTDASQAAIVSNLILNLEQKDPPAAA